jgi:hypothetical protein
MMPGGAAAVPGKVVRIAADASRNLLYASLEVRTTAHRKTEIANAVAIWRTKRTNEALG